MKKPVNLLLLALATLMLAAGCTYPFQADIEQMDDVLVVEGNIVIGDRTVIALSKMVPLGTYEKDGTSYPDPTTYQKASISKFSAWIEGEDGVRVDATGNDPLYFDTRELRPDQRYRLCLADGSGSDTYESDWVEVLGAPVIDNISYNNRGYALQVTASMHSDESPYFSISYDERWEYHAWTWTDWVYSRETESDEGEGGEDTQPAQQGIRPFVAVQTPTISYSNERRFYRCWDHSDYARSQTMSAEAYEGNQLVDYPIVSFNRYDPRISVLYNLQLRACLISPESYQYWQNMDKISKPNGDLFTPIPSSMRGNLHKVGDPAAQVLGFISASTATYTSYFIDNDETGFYAAPYEQQKKVQELRTQTGMNPDDWTRAYRTGYWPFLPNSDIYGNIIGYTWIAQECVDCRMQGGSINRPSDWPKK